MESSTQQVESVFPSEAETASFFSSEEWDSMVDYDKNSYRNILHNYYTMQLLGLNPVKPLFMTKQTSKKAAKRKSDRSPSSHPIKNQNKEAKSSTSNSTKEAKNSTSNTHIEAKSSTSNTRKEAKSSTSNTTIEAKSSTSNTLKGLLVQEAEMFSSSKTTESIHLNNIFNAVFKVYKRYNGKIKGHYLKKKVSTEKEKKCGKRNKENYLKSRTQSNNESEGSQKNKKDQKRAPPKKPCRSIQTQTASSDHSILSSALVFVNRTGTKKVTRPLPDPRPAPKTKEEELRIRKQNRLKLKNCRRVQTQTAGENTTIEKSNLVFFPVLKPKTVKKESSSTQTDPTKKKEQGFEVDEGKFEQEKIQVQDKDSLAKSSKAFQDKQSLKTKFKKEKKMKEPSSRIKALEKNSIPGCSSSIPNDERNNECKKVKSSSTAKGQNNKNEEDSDGFDFSDPSQQDTDKRKKKDEHIKPNELSNTQKARNTKSKEDSEEFDFSDLSQHDTDGKNNKHKEEIQIALNTFTKIQTVKQSSTNTDSDDFQFSDLSQEPDKRKNECKEVKTILGEDQTTYSQHNLDSDGFDFSDLSQGEAGKINEKTTGKKSRTTLVIAKKQKLKEPKDHGKKDEDYSVPNTSKREPERRYPRRSVAALNYTEGELLQDDDYLFCDACDREYEADCPEHGPHTIFSDSYAPITGEKDRALQTTPGVLNVAKSMIPGAGSGVWTTQSLPGHVRLGPYEGEKSDKPDPLGYSWTIMKDRRIDHYIAANSAANSNWMRYVNCARHESEQNLMAFQYKGKMYYRTVKPIPPKVELFVWYGKEYAEKLGISMESFRNPDTSHLHSLVFPCDKCGTSFTSPLYLEGHQKYCRGKSTAPVRVDSVPSDVQTLARVCEGKKTYQCHLCDYKTSNTSHIRRHLVVHSGQRAHSCDVCGKGFTQAGNLVQHKRIHSGDKPYKCNECSYSCNVPSHLRTHVMARHRGEKKFACGVCKYKTADSGNMEIHSRTHTGEKPYCCSLCTYRATQKSSLVRHMRTHTG